MRAICIKSALYTGTGKTRQKAVQNIFKFKLKATEHRKKKQCHLKDFQENITFSQAVNLRSSNTE